MEIENYAPDESSGLEVLRSSSTSGARHPKQPKPIRTAQADAVDEVFAAATQPDWQHSQEQSRPRRRARGERRGGGNREGRTEGEDYHKEAAINARPKRATRETRRWPPKKSVKRFQIRSSTDQRPATDCIAGSGRASPVHSSAPTRSQTHWLLPPGRLRRRSGGRGHRRKKEATCVDCRLCGERGEGGDDSGDGLRLKRQRRE